MPTGRRHSRYGSLNHLGPLYGGEGRTRADILAEHNEQQRWDEMQREKDQQRFNERFGEAYKTYIADLAPDQDGYDAAIRELDPRFKNIPGIQPLLEKGQAEHAEYIKKRDAEKKAAEALAIKEQKQLDEIRDYELAQVKKYLEPDIARDYMKARVAGDNDQMQSIYDSAIQIKNAQDEQEQKDKALAAQIADEDAKIAASKARITSTKSLKTALLSENKHLFDKEQAHIDFHAQNEATRQAQIAAVEKDPTKVLPQPLTFDEQMEMNKIVGALDSYDEMINSDRNFIERITYNRNNPNPEAPIDIVTEDEKATEAYGEYSLLKDHIPQLEEQLEVTNANSAQAIGSRMLAVKLRDEAIQEREALQAGFDANSMTGEQVEQLAALDQQIEDADQAIQKQQEKIDSYQQRGLNLEDRMAQFQTEVDQYKENKYQSMLEPDGSGFKDDTIDRNFRAVYSKHARDKGLSPNPLDPSHRYDYMRAFADGELTMETEELPDEYKLDAETDGDEFKPIRY